MFLRTSPLCKGHATSIIKRVAHETHPRLVPRSLQSTLHDWPFAVCSLLSASPLQRPNLNKPSAPCCTPDARLAAGVNGSFRGDGPCSTVQGSGSVHRQTLPIRKRTAREEHQSQKQPQARHTKRPHGRDRRVSSARSGDVVKAGAGTACVSVLSLTRCIFRRSETDKPFRRKDDGRMVRYRVVCERVQPGDRRQGACRPLNAGEIHVGNL